MSAQSYFRPIVVSIQTLLGFSLHLIVILVFIIVIYAAAENPTLTIQRRLDIKTVSNAYT